MLQLLANFIDIADAGTITRAAVRTGLPKSTLSRSLATLEAQLAVRLVQRTPRALKLTPEGERLYQAASPGVRVLQATLSEAALGSQEPRGRIRLSAPVAFGRTFLSPLVGLFLNMFPRIEVEVILSDRQVNLVEDGFDLAFRIGNLQDSALITRRLATTRRVLAASPSYIAQCGSPTVPHELRGHRIGAVSREMELLQFLHPSSGPTQVNTHSVLVAEPEILADAVREGAILAPLPRFLVETDLASASLIEVLLPWRLAEATLQIVYPSTRGLAPAVRHFIDMSVNALNCNPRWQKSLNLASAKSVSL